MEIDPVAEWRRLTDHYRQMHDIALQQIARDYADLTETAQQVLRDELRHRGLPQPGSSTPPAASTPLAQTAAPPRENGDASEYPEDREEGGKPPVEYTWRTMLCECEESDQVWQLREMLRRAGIESWSEAGLLYPRILVAADQLEEARAVIARPIPQDVIDDSHTEVPEYEMPRCPSCRAEDPVLEETDPVNTWQCEACGRQWSDSGPVAEGSTPEYGL